MAGSVLLSRSIICSIIAAGALHRRVRNGNGCCIPAMATSQKGSQEEDIDIEEMRFEVFCPPHWIGLFYILLLQNRPFRDVAGEKGGQVGRLISTGQLNALPRLHFQPIDPVVFREASGRSHLWGGLALRCFQRLSFRGTATRRCPWRDNRNTGGHSFPVLSY